MEVNNAPGTWNVFALPRNANQYCFHKHSQCAQFKKQKTNPPVVLKACATCYGDSQFQVNSFVPPRNPFTFKRARCISCKTNTQECAFVFCPHCCGQLCSTRCTEKHMSQCAGKILAWKHSEASFPGFDATRTSETPSVDVGAMASSLRRRGVAAGSLDTGSSSRLNESAVLDELDFSQDQSVAYIQPEPIGGIHYTRERRDPAQDPVVFGYTEGDWNRRVFRDGGRMW